MTKMDVTSRLYDALQEDFGFEGATGSIRFNLEQFWLKNLWEICSTSGVWPIKVQYKNKVIQNIRPATWYSEGVEYPPFQCLEDFLAALEETIYKYHDTRSTIAEHWSEQVCRSYKKHYGIDLELPRWNDVKKKYIRSKE